MLTLLRHKNPCAMLGIDISSTAVNILALSSQQAQYCVEGHGRALLPNLAVDAGCIRDIDAVVGAIRLALIETNTRCKQAVLAVPNAFTISKTIQMSASLSDRDMDAWVRLDVEKHFSYSLADIYLDFDILGPSAQNPAMLDVLIVASRAKHVNQRVEVIRRAGLLPRIVEVESYAFERAALLLTKAESLNTTFLIDIGTHMTNYMIFDGVTLIFSREEALNGDQFIRADEAHVLDQSILDLFLIKLKRAWQLFSSTKPDCPLEKIVIASRVGHLPGLSSVVQTYMKIPCIIANPLCHMTLSNRVNRKHMGKDVSSWMVACGLALRGARGKA